jgi:hypothetical protein
MPTETQPEFLTVAEVGAILRLSPDSVARRFEGRSSSTWENPSGHTNDDVACCESRGGVERVTSLAALITPRAVATKPAPYDSDDPTKCGDCNSPIDPSNCCAFADKDRCDQCANKIYACANKIYAARHPERAA